MKEEIKYRYGKRNKGKTVVSGETEWKSGTARRDYIPQSSLWECFHVNLIDSVLNQVILCAWIHMPLEGVIFKALSTNSSACALKILSKREITTNLCWYTGMGSLTCLWYMNLLHYTIATQTMCQCQRHQSIKWNPDDLKMEYVVGSGRKGWGTVKNILLILKEICQEDMKK